MHDAYAIHIATITINPMWNAHQVITFIPLAMKVEVVTLDQRNHMQID
jgi:hypothetical protein